MHITSVHIENFGLIREVDISLAPTGLTVIRGNNASGKTTLLDALRWGLYGEDGLDARRKSRISATDLGSDVECKIFVEIDLERTLHTPGGAVEEAYRLTRTAVEVEENGVISRKSYPVELYEITDDGLIPIASPESIIEVDLFPIELKDIFLIDGDEALAFVSAQHSRADKRSRVRDAIRSLLGLSLLEAAEGHLKQVDSRFRKAAGEESGDKKMLKLEEELAEGDKKLTSYKESIKKLTVEIEKLTKDAADKDKELEEALEAGNYEELAARKSETQQAIQGYKRLLLQFKDNHRKAMEEDTLSWALMSSGLDKGFQVLEGLRERGIIPRSAVPFIKEKMNAKICICGTSLEQGTDARVEVERQLAEHKEADEERQLQAELLSQLRTDVSEFNAGQKDWIGEVDCIKGNRLSVQRSLQSLSKKIRKQNIVSNSY